ncbi:MAG TPA: methionyl-tRNA formyltransferase [Candidatus Limnocylindrales bacterium]|nr:methionyl-tRNA formyltransferase [Candidatus Limnocylindrales bacterium]
MKLVFCGTPQFAVPCLERLSAAGHNVQLVVTQPDRPQGRGMTMTAPPVKQMALKLGLPVAQPEKIRNNEAFQKQLTELHPDAIIVVGYGRIIPGWMLHLPPYGNINVHASLLPKFRGAAPIQWAIARGETVTGVTTMRIDEGLDTGDILLKRETPILPADTAVTLAPRLAELGADLLVETLQDLQRGLVDPVPQDDSLATLAPILKKEDGMVDFQRSAADIVNRLRGFQPWPGAYTHFRGKNLKIIAAGAASGKTHLDPGALHVSGDQLFAGCGHNTWLELLQVQPEGKKAISAREFISGYRPAQGERLG